jgi:hypothetical protein
MGIGYYHWHRTSAFLPDVPMHWPSAPVHCAPLPSAFADGTYTYLYREHEATEDAGLGFYVLGSRSQAAGVGQQSRSGSASSLVLEYSIV